MSDTSLTIVDLHQEDELSPACTARVAGGTWGSAKCDAAVQIYGNFHDTADNLGKMGFGAGACAALQQAGNDALLGNCKV